jgi:hypothetical protein
MKYPTIFLLLLFLLLLSSCTAHHVPQVIAPQLEVTPLQIISLPERERSESTHCFIRDFNSNSRVLIECDQTEGTEIIAQRRYSWSPSNGLTYHREIDSRVDRWIDIERITNDGEIFGTIEISIGRVQFVLKNGQFEYPYPPSSQVVYLALSPNGRIALAARDLDPNSFRKNYFLVIDGREEALPLNGYVIDTAVVNDRGDCAGGLTKLDAAGNRVVVLGGEDLKEPQGTERGFVLLRGMKPVILNTLFFSRFDDINNEGVIIGTSGEGPVFNWIVYTKEQGVVDLRGALKIESSREYSFPSFVGYSHAKFLISGGLPNPHYMLYDGQTGDPVDLVAVFKKSFPDKSLFSVTKINNNFEFVGVSTSKDDSEKWEFFFAKLQGYN